MGPDGTSTLGERGRGYSGVDDGTKRRRGEGEGVGRWARQNKRLEGTEGSKGV